MERLDVQRGDTKKAPTPPGELVADTAGQGLATPPTAGATNANGPTPPGDLVVDTAVAGLVAGEDLATPPAGATNTNGFATPLQATTAPTPVLSGPQQKGGIFQRAKAKMGFGSALKAVQATPVAAVPDSPDDSPWDGSPMADGQVQPKKKGKRVTFLFRKPISLRSPVRKSNGDPTLRSPVIIRSPVSVEKNPPKVEQRMTRSATKAARNANNLFGQDA